MSLKMTAEKNEHIHPDDLDFLSFHVHQSFRSKKHAINQGVIYVYCPENMEEKILSVVNGYDFKIILNDYSIRDFSKKVICHYQSASLSPKQKHFLINSK